MQTTEKRPTNVASILSSGSGREGGAASPIQFPWSDPPINSASLVWRHPGNPLIGRHHLPGVQGIYNSAVVQFQDRYAGVFRLENQTRFPRLHLGWSRDGIDWDIARTPIAFDGVCADNPVADYAYDPRVCPIEGRYVISWCGGFNGPTISLATTEDFETFERLENAFLPFNRNGVLFPRRIGGKYMLLSRPSDNGHTPFGDIYVSQSPDLCHWGMHRLVMRSGGCEQGQWWQRTKIGAGPVPIETDEGWLLIYHAVMDTCNGFVYSMGAALLDLDQPWQVRCRTNQHILTPEADYEVSGHVPNVVFPCAALCDEATDRVAIYYGAADTYCCLANARLSDLLKFVRENSCVY